MLLFMLAKVCRLLSDNLAQQVQSGEYSSSFELVMLFQLHALLCLMLAGKLTREDWDVPRYRKLFPWLRLPRT
jgi:hypothetical protein